jgi:hypothetical protein
MCLFYRASQLRIWRIFETTKQKTAGEEKKSLQSEKCDDGTQAARHYDQIKK